MGWVLAADANEEGRRFDRTATKWDTKMSKSTRNRAKTSPRKTAKRTVKRDAGMRKPFTGTDSRADEFTGWPLLECLISDSWRNVELLTHILVARKETLGKVVAAAFLVDQACLGAKDGFWRLFPYEDDYHAQIRSEVMKVHPLVPCSLDLAAAVITASMEYARSLGFEPHPDAFEALGLLGDLSTLKPVDEEIPLGLPNGKPLYMVGPDDNIDYIMETLRETVGDGNFEFMVPESLIY